MTHPDVGAWIRPADAETHEFGYVPAEWAKRWLAEEIWRARLLPR